MILLLVGCGFLQDYETGLQLYCDAPRLCDGCPAEADPARRAELASAWARDHVTNGRASMVWEKVREFPPEKRGNILRTAASQADIRPCAMADLYGEL